MHVAFHRNNIKYVVYRSLQPHYVYIIYYTQVYVVLLSCTTIIMHILVDHRGAEHIIIIFLSILLQYLSMEKIIQEYQDCNT